MAGGGAAQVLDEGAGDNGSAPLIRNELLTFVSQKLNYMPTDSIVQLCVHFYDEEVIDAANLLVHERCADSSDPSQWYRRRKGDRKKKATMEDIVGLLHPYLEHVIPGAQ